MVLIMIRFDLLMKYYTGKNTKIALLDNGIISTSIQPKDFGEIKYHASICAEIIKSIASDAEIIDFKICDGKRVDEKSLVDGIYRAIEDKVDIINISIGFDTYSNKLKDAINKAVDSDIIVVAAKNPGNITTFPANFPRVIEVGMVNDKNSDTIAEIIDYEIIVNENSIPIVSDYNVRGCSYACAFCAGILSLIIESRPLVRKSCLLDSEFRESISSIDQLNSIAEKKEIPASTVLYPDTILGFDIRDFQEYLDPNIHHVFNYDAPESFNLVGLNQHKLIINPHEYPHVKNVFEDTGGDQQNIFIGKYDNMASREVEFFGIEYIDRIIDCKSNKILDIDVPTVMVGGFGCNSNKFSTLLHLVRSFRRKDYNVCAVTHNPLGVAFNFVTLPYPETASFPAIVYSLNRTLYNAVYRQNTEVVIVDCPGAIVNTKADNSNLACSDFGQIPLAYMHALQIDTFVLSIPIGVSMDEIHGAISKIAGRNISNIVLSVAPIQLLPNDTPRDFTDIIYADIEKQRYYYSALQKEFPRYKCLLQKNFDKNLFDAVTANM